MGDEQWAGAIASALAGSGPIDPNALKIKGAAATQPNGIRVMQNPQPVVGGQAIPWSGPGSLVNATALKGLAAKHPGIALALRECGPAALLLPSCAACLQLPAEGPAAVPPAGAGRPQSGAPEVVCLPLTGC